MGLKNYLKKIMGKNFPDLAKGINLQVQEAEQTQNRESKKSMPQYMIIKILKTKNK